MGEPLEWAVGLYDAADGKPIVSQEVRDLGVDGIAKVGRALTRLTQLGLDAGGKHLEGKLWELRPDRYRVVYFAAGGHAFVVLRVFVKKSQKIPARELRLAEDRMADYERRTERRTP